MKELTLDNYESFTSEGKVVIDFWAEWCGPCKMLKPIFKELEEELDYIFAKVDVDENQELASQLSVRGIPTILLLEDGQEVDRIVGFLPKPTLKQKIESAFN